MGIECHEQVRTMRKEHLEENVEEEKKKRISERKYDAPRAIYRPNRKTPSMLIPLEEGGNKPRNSHPKTRNP